VPACTECTCIEQELSEIKEVLRALDRSEARGYEYSEDHERLEQRRESLLQQFAIHDRSH